MDFKLHHFIFFYRCVHVGDLDVRHQALPGGEEQRCDWSNRERGALGHALPVSPHPLQPDDQMLVVRPEQETTLHRTPNAAQVVSWSCLNLFSIKSLLTPIS